MSQSTQWLCSPLCLWQCFTLSNGRAISALWTWYQHFGGIREYFSFHFACGQFPFHFACGWWLPSFLVSPLCICPKCVNEGKLWATGRAISALWTLYHHFFCQKLCRIYYYLRRFVVKFREHRYIVTFHFGKSCNTEMKNGADVKWPQWNSFLSSVNQPLPLSLLFLLLAKLSVVNVGGGTASNP